MNFKKALSLSLGLVILGIAAVLVGTGTVGASPHLNSVIAAPTPSVPVTVVNPSLAVTGSVNANIGTPTVNVASLPTVNATLTNSSITVANPDTSPLPVHDVNDPADNPYSATACFSPSGTGGCTAAGSTFTVPSTLSPSGQAIKQLVVDFVSGNCYSATGGEVSAVSLVVTPPSGVNYYQTQYAATFVPVQTLSAAGNVLYVYSQQTRTYVLPGSTITFAASYNTQYLAGTAPPPLFCDTNLQGHFVTQ